MKKWSYVTALMLAASTGCVFTGCIDNDEPFGIEQIRVATAELLKAKKDAVAAEAAAANAAVEVEKIKAEIEKQRLENEKAKAEAEAKIQQLLAEAEAAKTQAEADILKAQAEAIRLAAEMDAKDRQAQIDRYIAATQDEIRNADLAYEKAVAAWEAMKIKYAENKSDKLYAALEDAYGSYLRQIENYNNLNTQYLLANQKSSEYQNDLVWDEEANGGKGGFVSPNRDQEKILTNQIAYLENEIAKSQKEIDDVNEFNTKLEAANASELGQLLAEYEEKQKANDEALVKLDVKKQLAIEENVPLENEVNQLKAEAEELANAEITIPAVEIPAVPSLPAVAGFQEAQKLDKTGVTYTLGDEDPYIDAVNQIQATITTLNNLMLDENDKLWNQASLNEIQRKYEALTGEGGEWPAAKAAWTNAKKVYNMGGAPDATAVPKEAELEAAIAAMVAAGEAFEPTKAAVAAAKEALKTANEELAAAIEENETTSWGAQYWAEYQKYEDALAQARADFGAARRAAIAAKNEAYKAADTTIADAQLELQKAQHEYDIAVAEYQADPTDAKKKVMETAGKKVNDAVEKWNKANQAYDGKIEAADKAYDKAIDAAEIAEMKARYAAEDAWAEYQLAFQKDNKWNTENDPAYKKIQEKQAAVEAADKVLADAEEASKEAGEKVSEAFGKVNEAVRAQRTAVDCIWYWDYVTPKAAVDAYVNGDEGSSLPEIALPVNYLVNGRYQNAYNYLVATSQRAYGDLWIDNDDPYNFSDEAFLVENVTQTMVDKYIAQYAANNGWTIKPYQYYWYYNRGWFGIYGEVLGLEHSYELGEAILSNNDIITSIVNGLKADLAEMEKTQLAAEKASEDATKAYEAKAEEYTYNTQGIFADEEGQLESQGIIYGDIIASLETAVAKIEMGEDSMEIVKGMITDNETKLENAQARIDYLNKLLADANYQLAQYQNGTVDYSINPYKYEAESLKALVDAAKEALAVAKARVEYLQSKYEASTK